MWLRVPIQFKAVLEYVLIWLFIHWSASTLLFTSNHNPRKPQGQCESKWKYVLCCLRWRSSSMSGMEWKIDRWVWCSCSCPHSRAVGKVKRNKSTIRNSWDGFRPKSYSDMKVIFPVGAEGGSREVAGLSWKFRSWPEKGRKTNAYLSKY